MSSNRKVVLEVIAGVHPITKKKGFFAYARALFGNFPVCWYPTEDAAMQYGKQFLKGEK